MRPVTRRIPLLLALVAVLLAIAACSSSGGEDGGDSDSAGAREFKDADAPAEAPLDQGVARRDAADSMEVDDASAMSEQGPPDPDDPAQKIIAKGNVSLEADDVGVAAFDVTRIADEHGGEVTERETTTNDDGEISTARLLLRIPVADFDEAFTDLEEAGDLQSSNTGKEDVTTKVIDTQVRIRAQRRSLARVEELLDRAQSISDIIRIEAQLSHRQADLESLERRLTYLNDQTSMSTISVNISLPPKEKKDTKEEPEEAGFLAGLENGWDALKSFGTGTATVAGALLPWAAVLLIIGAPILLLVRRLRRRVGSPDLATPADA
ncbi:DUF4349 domain-containing protein [Nocardioides sp. HM23]|uniref:DUF4349 domain-containing protein n=1 Tax=Nocardioides bizhenqiangii TaxID=3095076 RepID=UPI002ACA3721|nr:DUF4349 domain-containing protein [Nocardioides sp. HM23]MDZ5619275.1 DUF4349 domain-containing protein [Nocardioides sp. HM23]